MSPFSFPLIPWSLHLLSPKGDTAAGPITRWFIRTQAEKGPTEPAGAREKRLCLGHHFEEWGQSYVLMALLEKKTELNSHGSVWAGGT